MQCARSSKEPPRASSNHSMSQSTELEVGLPMRMQSATRQPSLSTTLGQTQFASTNSKKITNGNHWTEANNMQNGSSKVSDRQLNSRSKIGIRIADTTKTMLHLWRQRMRFKARSSNLPCNKCSLSLNPGIWKPSTSASIHLYNFQYKPDYFHR
jgi:hypothetical protein